MPRQKRAFANYCNYAKFSKDCEIVKSYANHITRIIDQHIADKSGQPTIRD